MRRPGYGRDVQRSLFAGAIVAAGVVSGALFAAGVVVTTGGRTPEDPRPSAAAPRYPAPVARILGETPLGRAAEVWVRQHHVRVVYRPGGGSAYSDEDGGFYLDSEKPLVEIAAIYVHETNHARNRGRPDAHRLSRRAYIDRSLDEEAHGTVLQIQENQQLQAARGRSMVPVTLLQGEYEAAYDAAVTAVTAARGRAPTATDRRRIGERAGEARVRRAFTDAEVVRSTDHGDYADAYGREWDDAHKKSCFLWVAC